MKAIKSLLLSLGLLSTSTLAFNDTLFFNQWAFKNTGQKVLKATSELNREEIQGIPGVDIEWLDMSKMDLPKDREIVVAVIDSGLDITHPDLKGKIWINKKECPGELQAELKEGKACHGFNFLKKNGDITDDTGHGTHVAGIIAAQKENSIGVAGVADSRVKIMPVKVLSNETRSFVYNGRVMTDIIADGIRFAIINGAHVINLSLGWPKLIETTKIRKALQIAMQRNIPIVVASGNNNKNIITYPCSTRGVICVGAYGNQGKVTEFSNYGGKVDLLGPGNFIVSTYPTHGVESRILRMKGYEAKKGTSQAAPFISAVAANLKLLNPKMTLNEVKARLINSTYKTSESDKGSKSSKYGRVSMKKAVMEKPETVITPDFKNLLDIKFSKDNGIFFFNMPIESLMGSHEKVKVSLETVGSIVELEQKEFEITRLAVGRPNNIAVKGKVVNLEGDNNVNLKVTISVGEYKSTTQTTLMFARDLKREMNVKKIGFKNLSAQEVTFFKGQSKISRLKPISDRFHMKGNPEFFIFDKKVQAEDKTTIKIVRLEDHTWAGTTVDLPKMSQVLAVFVGDYNFDKKADYFIYAMDEKKENLIFMYMNNEFKPLLGKHSTWEFPISEFEGLPLEAGSKEDFHWLRKDHPKLGSVLIPSIFKVYTMPEADNSDDILDGIPEDLAEAHLYFLNPVVKGDKVKVDLRVIDSFDFIENFRRKYRRAYRIKARDPIGIEKPGVQDLKANSKGQIETLISVGKEFKRRYFRMVINEVDDVQITPLFIDNYLLAGNGVFPIFDLDEKANPSSEGAHLALLNRSQARVYRRDGANEGLGILLDTKNYSDPIFNYIAGFNDATKTTFLESRYFVHAMDGEGKTRILPINRDSSFPGMNFSETLAPLKVEGTQKNHPGVFINSTLIFGDRLYTMVNKPEGFIRPVNLSIARPKQCTHMEPMRFGENGQFQYILLCRKNAKEVEMWTLPITTAE